MNRISCLSGSKWMLGLAVAATCGAMVAEGAPPAAPAKPAASAAPVAPVQVDPRQVDAAIDRAVEFLLANQQKDGSWEVPDPAKPGKTHAWGGETAIVTYALLAAGQSPQTPAIKKAVAWLQGEDLHGTYAVGLRAQVWNLLPEKSRTAATIAGRERDKEYVLYARGLKGAGMGFYGYSYGNEQQLSAGMPKMPLSRTGGAGGDRSNSQYGVLGAWALEQAGAEIPTSYWMEEDAAWKKDQQSDGGWAYGGHATGDSTATMTAAGLASLFVTQDYVMRANAHQFDKCTGGVTNINIEKGLAWFDRHAVQALAGGGYGLYGIERVGVASGRKYFGAFDWYRMGAEHVLKRQAKNGSWGAFHETCFNMLFLIRGKAPVMMNKLMYESPTKKQTDPWNERPRDVANLAKWMGKHSLEGFLNWQIVNLQVPVDELHDAPILYIAGSDELLLSNQEIEKLRTFVEQGGMILGNADCGSKSFAQSFEKMGNKMFPKYEFRKLQMSHPIFDEQYHAAKWKSKPIVEAMSNGIRELMILIPQVDPGHAWQNESTKIREENFQLGGNIFLYATGKENLTSKGDTYIVHATGPAARPIKVARIQVAENWDPEPGGWRRLSAVMHNTRKVDVTAEPVKLGEGKLATYKIAHLTGTTKMTLTAAQEAELKSFVDAGGTLIVDAAGGSPEFADAAETELNKIWGAAANKGLSTPLPPDHLLFTTPGAAIEKINYRTFARKNLVGKVHDPRIRGIVFDKPLPKAPPTTSPTTAPAAPVDNTRIGVFYSREDLTAGLVGEPVDGVVGYSPENATMLMANMVMYADLGGIVVPPPPPPPATKPATQPSTKQPAAKPAAPAAAPAKPAPAAAPAAGAKPAK